MNSLMQRVQDAQQKEIDVFANPDSTADEREAARNEYTAAIEAFNDSLSFEDQCL